MADRQIITVPPYGYDCMSCPLALPVAALGPNKRQCRGAPPTATPTGQAATGQLIYESLYRAVGLGDWCGEHPMIKARLGAPAMAIRRPDA